MKKILFIGLCCLCLCGCGNKEQKEKTEKQNKNQEIIEYIKNHHLDEWSYKNEKVIIDDNNNVTIKLYNIEHWTECAISSEQFVKDLTDGDYSSLGINEIMFECLDSSSENNSYVSIKNLSDVEDNFYKSAVFLDNNKNTISQTIEDGLKQLEQEFKNECAIYTYKEIFRNPENYKGKKIKITGEVIQVIDDNDKFQLRVNMTKNEYDFYEDTIFVEIAKDKFDGRIIENDIITFWGINGGTISYETVMGNETTIPAMIAYYAELLN